MTESDNTGIPDLVLIAKVKEGNRLAFKVIYDRYWDSLFTAAYKLLKDQDAAQDVVQEVFFDLWNRIHRVEISNLGGFLFNATRFQSLKQLRKGNVLDIHEERYQQILSNNSIEEQLNFDELQQTIENTLDQLPEKYKVVFQLSRMNNLTNKEIAQELNLSIRTVEWYLHVTLKHLKSTLASPAIMILGLMGWW